MSRKRADHGWGKCPLLIIGGEAGGGKKKRRGRNEGRKKQARNGQRGRADRRQGDPGRRGASSFLPLQQSHIRTAPPPVLLIFPGGSRKLACRALSPPCKEGNLTPRNHYLRPSRQLPTFVASPRRTSPRRLRGQSRGSCGAHDGSRCSPLAAFFLGAALMNSQLPWWPLMSRPGPAQAGQGTFFHRVQLRRNDRFKRAPPPPPRLPRERGRSSK